MIPFPYQAAGAGLILPASSGGVPSYWAHVKAQLHFEGSDGSTTITDTGPLGTAFTAAGTAAIRTAGGIFGSSAFEPGSAGSADADKANFAIGANVPFTIRFWVRKPSGTWAGVEKAVCGVWGTSAFGWLISIDSSQRPTFYWSTNGTSQNFPTAQSSQALPNDTNAHMVSVSRKTDGTMMFHRDGVYGAPSGPPPGTAALANPSGTSFRVGAANNAGSYGAPFGASRYIDELEVIIGECLYDTTNYTPPTGPFPTY